ncbi:uncharacterized protein LOC101478108 [Maylandia zebra]|uniref:uncharacterized protein LOC101478108 n=1 Tax=Maylandia zebra TaxID=106582 RepID=UPI00403CB17A
MSATISIMNLWLNCRFHFLFAALVLSSSALTPEECKPLVTPLSMEDPSVMYGRVNFLLGYTSHDVYKALLNLTDSSWVKISASPVRSGEVVMLQENRMNGTCMTSTTNVTFEGNTATVEMANSTSSFYLLPSCDGCLVFVINSTARNTKRLLKLLKIDIDASDEFVAHSLYLLGKESTLKEPELEHFKQQATCLGFSGDPDFIYNPEKSFCAEGEGIKIPN